MLGALGHQVLLGVELLDPDEGADVDGLAGGVDAFVVLAGGAAAGLLAVAEASAASGDHFGFAHGNIMEDMSEIF